ncbi:twin-arginine translocase TatA/TatE family subunit [Deinococcus sp. YIM 77859]|uniref:twin-arginine translocase TatA/TatE family subunit n=1 Tax=Deinococcus sp. YIM 77859 TaxID=1540221 RepID=UPI000552C686|nr:twin-arginine translocase TatA/TatE family subunit [Deinococcus sp. YIM 77859]
MSFGPLEIILILVVIALLFGARKLPELGRGMGQGIKEFKREVHGPVPPVTDVQARPLQPQDSAPTEVTRTADGHGVTERDQRA